LIDDFTCDAANRIGDAAGSSAETPGPLKFMARLG
jgi:hypothetical protein